MSYVVHEAQVQLRCDHKFSCQQIMKFETMPKHLFFPSLMNLINFTLQKTDR